MIYSENIMTDPGFPYTCKDTRKGGCNCHCKIPIPRKKVMANLKNQNQAETTNKSRIIKSVCGVLSLRKLQHLKVIYC